MDSNAGEFWDARYSREGAIWGDGPSPTALLVAQHMRPGTRILEIGFGYGRDLAFLGRQKGVLSGIDLSLVGREKAEARLRQSGVRPEHLWTGSFETADLPAPGYDMVVCHRLAHLLLAAEAVERFTRKVAQAPCPGGLLCLGVRNRRDLNPAEMIQVADDVYEYACRPGHRVRYWDHGAFHTVFGKEFTILTLADAVEDEAVTHPVPCHLTVMLARKRPTADSE